MRGFIEGLIVGSAFAAALGYGINALVPPEPTVPHGQHCQVLGQLYFAEQQRDRLYREVLEVRIELDAARRRPADPAELIPPQRLPTTPEGN